MVQHADPNESHLIPTDDSVDNTKSHGKEKMGLDDVENQGVTATSSAKQSAFKALGWLDRFLAVWILLAMIIGILLGNFVPGTAEALEKGQFVGVSVPIGT
jgi:ACR3 family arsenite transporter